MKPTIQPESLMTSREVAAVFNVSPYTVTRWAGSGKLPHLRTVGGHLRFREADMRVVLQAQGGAS